MQKLYLAVLQILILLYSAVGLAQRVQFGAEFVFTTEAMIAQTKAPSQMSTEAGRALLKKWTENVVRFCQGSGECKTKNGSVKGYASTVITFNDGFWIEISQDPVVLEVTMSKGTVEDFEKHREKIENLVFGMSKELGMYVHDRIGGGHISVDMKTAFRDNALHFRNFFVDYSNHPELAWGIFGNHLGNAPPISALRRHDKEMLYDVLRRFDANPVGIESLATTIHTEVYQSNPNDWKSFGHYQAIRLDNARGNNGRMELRGFAPQKSLDAFIKLCKLIEHRIDFLEPLNHPIELQLPKSEKMPPTERVARASQWFQEMNLDLNNYRDVFIADHREVQPLPSLVPLAENMSSMGISRRPYEGVDLVMSQLPEQAFESFETRSKNLAGGERYLVPFPKMITEEDKDLLRQGTEQRGRAMMAFFRDLQGEQNFLRQGKLEKSVVDRAILNDGTSWEAVNLRASSSMGFVYAPDIVRQTDGSYVVLEDNVSSSTGGLGDAVQSRKDFLSLMPQFEALLQSGNARGFARLAAEFLKKHGDGKAVAFIMRESEKDYNKFYVQQLAAAGIYIITEPSTTGYSINSKGERPVVTFNEGNRERQVELGAVFFRGFGGGGFRTHFPKTLKAAVEGRVKLVGYSVFDFLGDKELSRHIEDMIRFYLKEEPILKFAKTIPLGQANGKLHKENVEAVFAQLEKWVVKDTTGLQGSTVWIGSSVKDKQALLNLVKEQPGKYVAQEYIPVSRINRWITDIRVHSMVLGDQAVASDVFWGRAVSVFDNGKLNTHQNAGAIPIFVENRDTISSELRASMSQIFQMKDLGKVLHAILLIHEKGSPKLESLISNSLNKNKARFERLLKSGPSHNYLSELGRLANKDLVGDELARVFWTLLYPSSVRYLQEASSAQDLLQRIAHLRASVPAQMARAAIKNTQAHFEALRPTNQERLQWVNASGNPLLVMQRQRPPIRARCDGAYSF